MRTWKTGLWAASLAIAVWCAGPPGRAEAQSGWSTASYDSSNLDAVLWPIVIGGTIAGAAALAISVADVVSFAMGSPFDDGWAVVDIVLGGIWTLAGAVGLGIASAHDALDSWVTGISAAGIALGALNITHGAWSLATNDRPPGLAPAISPIEGGAMASIAGTF